MSACSSDLDYGENMMNNSPEYTDSGDIYAYVQTRDTTEFSFGMHTFRLKCMQYGAYVLRVDEYYEDIHTGYGQMIIIVEGN